MTPRVALIELLARVGAQNGTAVFVNAEELRQWPAAAVSAMKSQKLLTRARPAQSVVCPGCERECVMPVHTVPTEPPGSASFVVCDKRSDINRVPVSNERLVQWRCNAEAVADFIAVSLNLRRSEQDPDDAGLLNIGIAFGAKRSQMLCLRTNGDLALVAASNATPLAELVGYDGGVYSVDGDIVGQLVDSATTSDPRYTPSNAKREARKLETREMHERWQDAYRTLKRKHRNKSDVWCSQQIAKQDIAASRSAETIRKRMKK
jgi:hypothetical protein